jgi:hypothetical protein
MWDGGEAGALIIAEINGLVIFPSSNIPKNDYGK